MSVNTDTQNTPRPVRTPPRFTPCRKKPAASPSSVVLPKEVQEQVIALAKKEDRSFSSVIRLAVAAYVDRHRVA